MERIGRPAVETISTSAEHMRLHTALVPEETDDLGDALYDSVSADSGGPLRDNTREPRIFPGDGGNGAATTISNTFIILLVYWISKHFPRLGR